MKNLTKMFRRSLFIAVLICINLIELSSLSEVEDLKQSIDWSTEDFATNLKKKNLIVEFYITLCQSCNSLYSILWKLMGIQNIASTSLAIGAINCSVYESFCISNNVTTYPTLLYFEKDDGVPKKSYNLSTFMSEKTLVKKDDADQNVTSDDCKLGEVYPLTNKNFDSSTKSRNFFVKFFQPSCVFCIAIKQVWIDLATELKQETAVCIGELDCSDFKETCAKYHITAVPKMIWFDMIDNNGTMPAHRISAAKRYPCYPKRILVYISILGFIQNYLFIWIQ
ncbi:thioredoxin domain-containing protein 5 homolog isoform X2 [Drosophila obscura]|uniref:thioredoxin domain-containing protein 5 homolog isoform X2 n=1 Tax=Drosophila obscura TaxID=7282 RepID=UPI001BB20C4F|nr:thioredoxin domain-containing protein 5 homolog isoform X2 [Drosophila obscura]